MSRGRPTQIPVEAILDAARDLLLKRGLRATTAEIAARAGVSEGLVFHRYRTKDALLVAVLERENRIPPRLEELAVSGSHGSLRDNLAEIGALLLQAARSIHPLIELVFSSPGLPRLRRILDRSGAGPAVLQATVARYLSAEMAAGRLRRMNAGLIARVLFGAILDRVLAARAGVGSEQTSDEDFLADLAELLLQGALPPAPTRRAARPRRA